MPDVFDFPGMPVSVPEVPERLRHIVTALYSYGFILMNNYQGKWILQFPADSWLGFHQETLSDEDLADGLLDILRREEEQRGDLIRFKQADPAWRLEHYGTENDTRMGKAGCGPTVLAIVMQHLISTRARRGGVPDFVSPMDAARYAVSVKARITNGGTSGRRMIKEINSQWPEYEGMSVSLPEAEQLVEEGWLIIFSCKGIKGFLKDGKPQVYEGGHFMVLSGVKGGRGGKRLFHVMDPGGFKTGGIRFVTHDELRHHGREFWVVYPIDENPFESP